MKGLVTVTHILFPVFIGLTIGGFIFGEPAVWGLGIVLIILDIVVGIILQYIHERLYSFDEHSVKNFKATLEQACAENKHEKLYESKAEDYEAYEYEEEEEDEGLHGFCEQLDRVYARLKSGGGARLVTGGLTSDEAGELLIGKCIVMPHAPLPHTIARLYAVSIEDLAGDKAIVYSFLYRQNSICENVYIFLVHTKEDEVRMFAVETDYSRFVLCEYSGSRHLNYGPVELSNVPMRIKEVLYN